MGVTEEGLMQECENGQSAVGADGGSLIERAERELGGRTRLGGIETCGLGEML